jgi:hypothetical protein
MPDEQLITAYLIHDHVTMGVYPAPVERAWMSAAHERHPYRCLPLNIANQNGWVLTSPVGFRAYWYGGPNPQDLELRFDGEPDPSVASHFGSGVVTFSLPFLFRTPPGVNLWVKGPSNWPKDGICPLEGVVETDWASSTFTMNWKVTRVCEWVGFEGVDIGPKTVAVYGDLIKGAGTVIWNGPVGWFEQAAFSRGTQGIAEAMTASAGVTVVGGGETAEAVEQFGFADKLTHVSTGGGAFLAYVEGKKFQSLAQIDDK